MRCVTTVQCDQKLASCLPLKNVAKIVFRRIVSRSFLATLFMDGQLGGLTSVIILPCVFFFVDRTNIIVMKRILIR